MYYSNKIARLACALILISSWQIVYGQQQSLFALQPLPLEVSDTRTVSLSFPSEVKTVDRGSSDLMALKPKGIDNVVLLKAAKKDIAPTSLIVITSDGDMHTFQVQYQQEPGSIGFQILPSQLRPAAAQISESIDQMLISEAINKALERDSNMNRRARQDHFSVTLSGLYISGPVIYLRLQIANRSSIDYDIGTLRIITADKKQIRRTASQQDEIHPIGASENIQQIKAADQQTLVLAIPKLTLPKAKRIWISIIEKNGARNLSVGLKNRHLARIQPL